jgi:hypothetical protein
MKILATMLALGLAPLLASHAAPPAAFGPPLVCFPFDIGSARSLPWSPTGDPFEVDAKYPVENLVVDTVKILDESQDVLVHMETLRRAAIYASRAGDRPVKGSHQMTKGAASLVSDRFVVKLLDRSMRLLAKDPKSAVAWVDAGYALGAAEKMGNYHGCDYLTYFETARADAPSDAAYQFAYVVGILDSPDHAKWEAELKDALARAPQDSLLRKNVLAFGKHYLGQEKLDALLSKDKK